MSITPQGIDTSSPAIKKWFDAGCPIDGPLSASTLVDPVSVQSEETTDSVSDEEASESSAQESAE